MRPQTLALALMVALFAGSAFAAVPVNNSLYGGQANACAFKILGRVQAVECAEKLPGIFHVETGAVVFDAVNRVTVLLLNTKPDDCLLALPGKLPSVLQQVLQHQIQQMFITLGGNIVIDLKIHTAFGLQLA